MAKQAIQRHGISIRLACFCMRVSESCYHYLPKLSSENEQIANGLLRLATVNKRWGFGLCYLYLCNVKGNKIILRNHKRIYRLYRELNLRIKPRRRLKRGKPDVLSVPTAPNNVWPMDFMSDCLADGRPMRTFNVIDDYNREVLGIEVGLPLPVERVIRSLE